MTDKKEDKLKDLVENMVTETFDLLREEFFNKNFSDKFKELECVETENAKYYFESSELTDDEYFILNFKKQPIKKSEGQKPFTLSCNKNKEIKPTLEGPCYEDNPEENSRKWLSICRTAKIVIKKVNEEYEKLKREKSEKLVSLMDDIANIDKNIEDKAYKYNVEILTESDKIKFDIKDYDLKDFEEILKNNNKFIQLPIDGEKYIVNKDKILDVHIIGEDKKKEKFKLV